MSSDNSETRSGAGSDPGAVVWIEALDPGICWRLVARRPLGRVGFVLDGEPVVLPVNHLVDGHSIVFRTGPASLLAGLRDAVAVAFEVDEADGFEKTGWSVLVKGTASEITDPAELAELADRPLEPWAPRPKDQWIRIAPSAVTGRAIGRQRGSTDGRLLPYMPAD